MSEGTESAWVEAAAGPLARAELRFAPGSAHPAVVGALVDVLSARIAGDPRVRDEGVHAEAGCGPSRCVVVLEGLVTAIPAAKAAAEAALAGPPPRLGLGRRMALQQQWRTRAQQPGTVLEAALLRALDVPGDRGARLVAAAERPRFDAGHLRAAWSTLAQRVAPLEPAPTDGGPISPTPSDGALLLVDWPGAGRAQVALAWASSGSGADLVRDGLVAGDFESLLVQRLREAEGLSYDVEADAGEGWSAAFFDCSTDVVGRALAAAETEFRRSAEADAARIQGARARLAGRAAAAMDSLAGRLALLAEVGPVPEYLPPVPITARVVVADAAAVRGQLGGWTIMESDRCEVVFGGRCP
jgi:hypothetical protein